VANRSNVAMRLRALEFCLRHDPVLIGFLNALPGGQRTARARDDAAV